MDLIRIASWFCGLFPSVPVFQSTYDFKDAVTQLGHAGQQVHHSCEDLILHFSELTRGAAAAPLALERTLTVPIRARQLPLPRNCKCGWKGREGLINTFHALNWREINGCFELSMMGELWYLLYVCIKIRFKRDLTISNIACDGHKVHTWYKDFFFFLPLYLCPPSTMCSKRALSQHALLSLSCFSACEVILSTVAE